MKFKEVLKEYTLLLSNKNPLEFDVTTESHLRDSMKILLKDRKQKCFMYQSTK